MHLACHALSDVEQPLLSALALAPSETDDGLLTAMEILCTRVRADLVVLSAALAPQLARVRESVAAVRELDGAPVKVLVGGVAFAEAPELWRRLGADGYAPDAERALALGARLVGLGAAG